jgi:CheY-like chemotaxis protein
MTAKINVPIEDRTMTRKTILLVEDEDVVRGMVAEALQLCGYTVLIAGDGAAALDISEEFAGEIKLMLTDVVMPQMSGRQLTEKISLQRPNMKVLYMSGYTDDAIVRHGVLEEGTAFIGKPFSPDALVLKIGELLGASQPA